MPCGRPRPLQSHAAAERYEAYIVWCLWMDKTPSSKEYIKDRSWMSMLPGPIPMLSAFYRLVKAMRRFSAPSFFRTRRYIKLEREAAQFYRARQLDLFQIRM
jgi:hypothetical protein